MSNAHNLTVYGRRFFIDPEGLKRALRYPVMMWEAAPDGGHVPMVFATRAADETGKPLAGQSMVFDVSKVAKNARLNDVTIGRASNNDIIIEDPCVSKFHAYLSESAGNWSITDAGSTVGTWVESRRLKAHEATPVPDNTIITIGVVKLRFMLPAAFLAYLARQLHNERV